jgi:hypothetical protein
VEATMDTSRCKELQHSDDSDVALNEEIGDSVDYMHVLRSLVNESSLPGEFNYQFRTLPLPEGFVLQQFTNVLLVSLTVGGITHILFAGTRHNEESWCPISADEDAQLEESVGDMLLVPLPDTRKTTTVQKNPTRTLIRQFASNYCKKFYTKASHVLHKVLGNRNLVQRLTSAQSRKKLSGSPQHYEWKTHGLFPRIERHPVQVIPRIEEHSMLEDRLNEIEMEYMDEPLVAFNKIVDTLPVDQKSTPQIDALRRIVWHLDGSMENYQSIVEELHELYKLQELQESQQECYGTPSTEDRVRTLSQKVDTLSSLNDAKRRKIARLEDLLVSLAKNHPFSKSFMHDIFVYLSIEEDMDLKKRLTKQFITARPSNIGDFAPRSPDVTNQDDSVEGVLMRGYVRTGKGIPNSV